MPDVEDTFRVSKEGTGSPIAQYLLYRRHLFAYESALDRSGTSIRTCIDIGCGRAPVAGDLFSRVRRLIALDVAVRPLQRLRNMVEVHAIQANATRMPFADSSVDLVLAFQLIEHLEPAAALKLIREVRRVLSPNGRGFLTTPNARWRLLPGQRPWNKFHVIEYTPRSIMDLCRAAGIRREDLYGVVGSNGAHEIEKARVRQDPLLAWGGRPGRKLRLWQRNLKDRMNVAQRSRGGRIATTEDEGRSWFQINEDHRDGLDFWIEVTKE